jgi:transcriptional regulator with XRE-family HTH domain
MPVVSDISTGGVKRHPSRFVDHLDPAARGMRHHVGVLDPQAIGRRIVDLRRAAGIARQEDLAATFGISRSTIAGIEAGGDLPGRDLAVAMANYFRVPLDWLLCRTVPPGGPLVGQFVENPDELAILRFWRDLTYEERKLVGRMLGVDPPMQP